LGRFRRRLPAQRRPPLDPDERVVAWADAGDDQVVVATNLGLWVPGEGARLGWHEIHKAGWSHPRLTVVAAREVAAEDEYSVVEDRPPRTVALVDPGRMPEQVQARVTRSVAYTSHHPLPGGGGVRVVARRVPGRDGLRWAVRYDPGTAAVPAAAAALVAQARASITTGGTVVPPS